MEEEEQVVFKENGGVSVIKSVSDVYVKIMARSNGETRSGTTTERKEPLLGWTQKSKIVRLVRL